MRQAFTLGAAVIVGVIALPFFSYSSVNKSAIILIDPDDDNIGMYSNEINNGKPNMFNGKSFLLNLVRHVDPDIVDNGKIAEERDFG